MWLLFVALLSGAVYCSELENYDYDNNLEETSAGEPTSNIYILPKQIFNDGKPFYLKKDPVSGTLNFNTKSTPVVITEPPINEASDQSGDVSRSIAPHDISINTNNVRTQNIHDYLNLPVKYSSSKFVYPLVSSSYANLKYQGNNKNYISNHKYDSAVMKTNPVTTNNVKKYKTTYPTKTYSSTTKKVMNAFEMTTKAIPWQNYSSKKPYTSAPTRPLYSTTGQINRYNNTIRNNNFLPTKAPTENVQPTNGVPALKGNNVYIQNTTIPSVTVSSPSTILTTASTTKTTNDTKNGEKESGSMNFHDLFNYFFNNEENEDSTNVADSSTQPSQNKNSYTKQSEISSTSAQTEIKQVTQAPILPYKYNITTEATTYKPTRRYTTAAPIPINSSSTKPLVTQATASVPEYGSRYPINANFSHPTNTNNYVIAPTPSNNIQNQPIDYLTRPFNGHGSNFHPPSSDNMNNIRVSPGSQTASIVATGQLLSTTNNNFKPKPQDSGSFRVPIANPNNIITGVHDIHKGQVSATNEYGTKLNGNSLFRAPTASVNDVPISLGNQNSEKYGSTQLNNFRVPAANMNNIVISPGEQTASFITTSQLAMGAGANLESKPILNEQQIKNVENDINVYNAIKLSTQRPQGFTLPSSPSSTTTTPIISTTTPKSITIQQSIELSNQLHQSIRFPIDNTETASIITGTHNVKPSTAMLAGSNLSQQQPNNTIKFPTNQNVAQNPVTNGNGLVKLNPDNNKNDIYDRNNFKQQLVKNQFNGNHVVFERPQSQSQHNLMQNNHNLQNSLLQTQSNTPDQYKLPNNFRAPPPPPPGFAFKKPPFIHYPRKNLTLPNILPQFRPNTQQLPPSIPLPMNPELNNQLRPGLINRQQYLYNVQNLRYKPPMHFHYGLRPKNPMAPDHLLQQQPIVSPNRRHFELYSGNFNNRIYDRTLPQPQHLLHRNNDRNAIAIAERDQFDENVAKVVAANQNTNYDNQFLAKPVESNETPKIEPVTTLQMIQQQRLLNKNNNHVPATDSGLPVVDNKNLSDINSITDNSQLYVVYPMANGEQKLSNLATSISIDNIQTGINSNKPSTIQQNGFPYIMEKSKSRYILNSQAHTDFVEKSSSSSADHVYEQPEIVAENDDSDDV